MTKEISAQQLEFKLFATDKLLQPNDDPTETPQYRIQEYYVIRGQSFDEVGQVIDE